MIAASCLTACASIMGVEEPILVEGTTLPEAGAQADGNVTPETDGGNAPATTPDAEPPTCVGAGCPCAGETCGANLYCAAGICTSGCKTNEECAGFAGGIAPYCNLDRHECAQCLNKDHCGAEETCTAAGRCASRCADGGLGCKTGELCCNGLCINPKTDPFNCNGCAQPCAGEGALCCDGSCKATRTDENNCGTCGKRCDPVVAHADGICVAGGCSYAGNCAGGYADCDNNKANGCECACPPECSSCTTGGACVIDCSQKTCTQAVQCPPGRDCIIKCNAEGQCRGNVNCPAGKKCTLDCNGPTNTCAALVMQAQNSTGCIHCVGAGKTCSDVDCYQGAAGCKKHCEGSACFKVCETNCPTTTSCP